MEMTIHAYQRMQQRAISKERIELLRHYGTAEYSHGCRILFFDRHSRQRLVKELGVKLKEAERLSRLYIIEGQQGVIVTAGHRYRRIKRDYQPGRRQARRRSHRFHSQFPTR